MCIWILCRCWEWACGNCETQRVAWRVIEVIAIYFGIYFEMEAGNKSRVLRIAIFEKCLCMPSLGMMACEFSCRNMVDIWILPRLKYPALRVPPAETRLTVYRRLSKRKKKTLRYHIREFCLININGIKNISISLFDINKI